MPSTQKALILTKKFGDLVIDEISVPKPGAGEVLVKIIATSLNPVDWKIRKYGIFFEDYPAILGTDVSGEVEEVGEGVIEFKKGDRVFTQGQFVNERASFQQYAITLATTLARIPDNTSFDEASTFPVALNVVYVGLYNEHPYGIGIAPPISADTQGIYGGTAIIILGGASSVGQNAIQLAKISGFSPIITTASLKHTDYLKALGATEVLDRNLSTPDLASEIAKITSAPIKIVFDAVSSESTQRTGIDILVPGGQLITVLTPTVKPEQDKIVINSIGMLRPPPNVELLEKFYHDVISGFIEKGWLK
ncbi:chaperonin 10-like protein, partial [Pholiota molesta]